jgi:hypothetical protein
VCDFIKPFQQLRAGGPRFDVLQLAELDKGRCVVLLPVPHEGTEVHAAFDVFGQLGAVFVEQGLGGQFCGDLVRDGAGRGFRFGLCDHG